MSNTTQLVGRILDAITRENLRGMQANSVAISTDDYATLCLENNGKPVNTLWNIPLERRGRIMPGAFIMTSAGPDTA